MSLPDALDYAKQHQPSLRAAQARAQAALVETSIPRAQWFPRVGLSVQEFAGTANNTSALYAGAGSIDVPRVGGTASKLPSTADWTPYGASFAGVGLRQEVFDFGKIAAQSAVFDAFASAAQARADSEALDLTLAVKQAFFAVLASQALLSAADAAYGRSKEERDDAAARVKSGLLGPIALTRPEADLMRFDAARIRARGSLTAARAVLAAVVGYPQALLDATGPAPQPEAPPGLEGALEKAAEQDPDIRERAARLAAQQAKTHATLMELLPDLSFTATFSMREGGAPTSTVLPSPVGAGFLPAVPNYDVGLVLNWSIFDEGVLARRNASREYEAAAQADLDAVKLTISSQIQQAYYALDNAFQALPALQGSVAAAKANHDQASARFRAGMGTSLELADADAVLADAEIQLALGQFEWNRARARLARVIAEP